MDKKSLFVGSWRVRDMETDDTMSYSFIRSWVALTVKYVTAIMACIIAFFMITAGVPLLFANIMDYHKDALFFTLIGWWVFLAIIGLAAFASWSELMTREIRSDLQRSRNGDVR